MRGTALSLGFAIGALALGCELDTDPGQGLDPIEMRDGSAGAPEGGSAGARADSGPAGDGGPDAGEEDPPADGGEPGPCSAGCPAKTPVCLTQTSRCVECLRDRDCKSEKRPVCDGELHACVECSADGDCGGETPRCAATHRCVQCTADADCADPAALRCDPASAQCVACLENEHCSEAAPVCDVDARACVECLTNADCPSAEKPQCESNACVPCTDDEACAGRPDTTLCEVALGSPTAGTCVQCTVADESPCAGRVCDPEKLTCSDRPVASKHTCESCIADSECVADHRCIALQFAGAARANAYCMKQLSSSCARPYASEPINRESRSGAAAEDYCGVDEQTTTCEAIEGLLVDAECADGSDQACAREGSLCRSVNGLAHRCTYACTLAAQCPPGVSCGSGYCGGAAAGDD